MQEIRNISSRKMTRTLLILSFAFMGIMNCVNAQIVIASGDCGANGNNLTWQLTSDSVLTISGSEAMDDYMLSKGADAPWYSYRKFIRTIIIEDNVTSISDCAFGGSGDSYTNLICATIGGDVITIGNNAFWGCSGLTAITIYAIIPPAVDVFGTFYGIDKNFCILHVPLGSKNDYSIAYGWKDFLNIIDGTEFASSISGTVQRENLTTLDAGNVSLYSVSDEEKHVLIETVPIANDGTYLFTNVEDGNYIVKAIPSSSENALSTYYSSTGMWNLASLVRMENSLSVQNIDIVVISLPILNGNSFIGGYVGDDGHKSIFQKSVTNPIEDVNVYLQKEQNDWNIVAHTLTNAEGFFEFKNVPAGRYRVILDVMGIPHTNPQVVVINEYDTVTNIEYEITEDSINNKTGNVGIVGMFQSTFLRIYPNHTTDKLTIENEGLSITIKLYDILGKEVLNRNVHGKTEINISHLPKGVYNVRVFSEKKIIGNSKIVKQ